LPLQRRAIAMKAAMMANTKAASHTKAASTAKAR
jgi:hypothetical protein